MSNLRKLFIISLLLIIPGVHFAFAEGVILDPDPLATVEGHVGLTNEMFGSAQIYSSAAGVTYSAVVGGDGLFSVIAVANATLALDIRMNSFQNTSNATLRQYVYNQSSLVEGETQVVDLRRASGRIAGSVNVVGGSLKHFTMYSFSSDATVPEQFNGYVSVSAEPYVAEQPMPPLGGTGVYGSVTILAAAGCNVSRSLPTQYVDVYPDTASNVAWTVDVSDANCARGSLQGSLTVAGLDGLNADVTDGGKRLYVNGPVYRVKYLNAGETTYSFSDLQVGSYAAYQNLYFNLPYTYLNIPYQSNAFEILAGEITAYDQTVSLGTAHGGLNLTGSWGLTDIDVAQVTATPTGVDSVDLTTGKYDLVLMAGNSEIYYNYFRGSNYESQTGNRSLWYVVQYLYNDNRIPVTLAEGGRVDVGTQEVETSQSLVDFAVAQQDGQPEAQITRLTVYGSGFERDLNTDALLSQRYVQQTDYRTANSRFPVSIRGLPGTYQMQATGYGTDGRQYRATFEMVLGVPESTPIGSDIEVPFISDGGEEIGSLTFDNVTEGGETTVSEVAIGPNAPRNFKIFKVGGQPQYYDITTTAVFDGGVKVCINYDDSNISDPSKEANMALGHYDSVTGAWEVITLDGYPDTVNNVICGITNSFSLFAILEEDIVDTDGDGVIDEADNCPVTANTDQSDLDGDGIGDACDEDDDGDGIPNASDLCPSFYATGNSDLDDDGIGDPCDTDIDGDGVDNTVDNCLLALNPDQADFDGDTLGDACDTDDDADNVLDDSDLCPGTAQGVLIDTGGCSSNQRLESVCPGDGIYRNHGKYVSCVAREAERQVDMGLITEDEKGPIVSTAAQTDIGKTN